jgi:hypothetical protein
VEIGFAIQSYRSDSLPLSSQRCVNAFAESQPRGVKSKIAVFGAQGIDDFAVCGRGPCRGAVTINNIPYVVSGNQFYSISSDGTANLLGAGIAGINPVSIDGSDEEIAIVNGTNGYVYNIAAATLTQIADGDFNTANTVTVINSIFAYDWINTNKFFISGVLAAGTIDALDFASAESSPDRVLAVRNRNGLLMVFGSSTIEPWDHTGASDFPFSRIKGGTVDRGIAAPLAMANEDSALFFLGNDKVFYRLNGLALERVSTHALEKEWQGYTTVSDAFCFAVPVSGHKFIYLTFPTANATFGYDIATGLWHERVSWDASGAEIRWRVNCAVSAYNKVLVGDGSSGRVGILDPATYTECGDPIVTTLVSPPVFSEGRHQAVPCFELDMETGVGLTTGQGSDPQVMLEYSTDGGAAYSAPQLWRTMGAIGTRTTRLQWQELGSAYHYTFKITISDPVKRVVTGCRLPGFYAEPR